MTLATRKGETMTTDQKQAILDAGGAGVLVLVTGARGRDNSYLRKQPGFTWNREFGGFEHRLYNDSPRLIWVDDTIELQLI